nr:MAG TPA: hypothetical protein [Bacteriophage sp.]
MACFVFPMSTIIIDDCLKVNRHLSIIMPNMERDFCE